MARSTLVLGLLSAGTVLFWAGVAAAVFLVAKNQLVSAQDTSQSVLPSSDLLFSHTIKPTSGQSPTQAPLPTKTGPQPTYTPDPTVQKYPLKLYRVKESLWTLVPSTADIQNGEAIALAVTGASEDGFFDKARFQVDGSGWKETTEVNAFGEFYEFFTISNPQSAVIWYEIHHVTKGWR